MQLLMGIRQISELSILLTEIIRPREDNLGGGGESPSVIYSET